MNRNFRACTSKPKDNGNEVICRVPRESKLHARRRTAKVLPFRKRRQ